MADAADGRRLAICAACRLRWWRHARRNPETSFHPFIYRRQVNRKIHPSEWDTAELHPSSQPPIHPSIRPLNADRRCCPRCWYPCDVGTTCWYSSAHIRQKKNKHCRQLLTRAHTRTILSQAHSCLTEKRLMLQEEVQAFRCSSML